MAIIMATHKWHSYLQGHHFIIKTDHQSLKYLLEQRLFTLLQHKWLEKLMGFDYKIVYKKGRDNMAADALSRVHEVDAVGEIKEISTVQQGWLTDLLDSYVGDEETQRIIEGIAVKNDQFSAYQYHQGLIKYDGKLYVGSQNNLKNQIIWEFHDSAAGGHSGQDVTYKKLSQLFFLPNMRKEVNTFVSSCDICQRVKSCTQFLGELLQPLPILNQIWEEVSLDFIEGLPRFGEKICILVVINSLSKICHFFSLTHPYTATQVA